MVINSLRFTIYSFATKYNKIVLEIFCCLFASLVSICTSSLSRLTTEANLLTIYGTRVVSWNFAKEIIIAQLANAKAAIAETK